MGLPTRIYGPGYFSEMLLDVVAWPRRVDTYCLRLAVEAANGRVRAH